MKIEFIFTFHEKEQQISRHPFYLPLLKTNDVLLAYAMTQLEPEEQANLVKISTCVISKEEPSLPDWYWVCNGKFWLDDLENFRKEHGIKTSVPQKYISEWMAENT